jgi:signal transduction histidine kinase
MRWIRLEPAPRDALLAVGLTVALQLQLVLSERWMPGRAVAALLVTVPLAFRLRLPLGVLTIVVAGVAAVSGLRDHGPNYPVFPAIGVVLALAAVGSSARGIRLALAAGISLGGLFGASLLAGADPGGAVALALLVTVGGLVIGGALGILRFESEVFDERAAQLERERDERAQIAVTEERTRIARELHDVIGHSISVMGVQAGAVRSILRDDQQREREALLAVERTGRQAVGEMRRLIGLLRPDDNGVADPTPSLRRVEQLVGEMRDAGLGIGLSVRGDLSVLSPGVDLAGYRIIQEALTNALKHAPAARVEARLCCTQHELDIEVVGNGAGPSRTASGDVGHGLLGMRERTALYGGELTAGPTPTGGFSVHARIPLDGP